MVHYIINPWRTKQELFDVRKAFYPSSSDAAYRFEDTDTQDIQRAVALVSVWEHRGNCPHLVASTALLVAAILNDVPGVDSFCAKAAYSVAFSRFVTGLLDGYQDKKHKLSMYSIAKTINLPASFVELRHQATHEDLPSLTRLRTVAKRALQWIWDFYWKNLSERPEATLENDQDKSNSRKRKLGSEDGSSDEEGGEEIEEMKDIEALKKELRAEREMFNTSSSGSIPSMADSPIRDLDAFRKEMMVLENEIQSSDDECSNDEDQQEDAEMTSGSEAQQPQATDSEDEEEYSGCGWDVWEGPWVKKAIGGAGLNA